MGKHIAFFNIPAIGHVFPTLAVVQELVRRGHRVSYTSIEKRRPLIEAAGATVHCYRSLRPSDSDPAIRMPRRDGYISQSLLSFVEEAQNALAQLESCYQDDPPDLIAFDRMAFAGRVLAAKMDVPMIQLWPMLVSNEHWSLAQGTLDPTDPVFLAYLAKLESFLAAHCPGLDPAEFLTPKPQRHLAFYPWTFQYRGELFDSAYSFVGPCLRPPPGLWHPSSDSPILLATLGTIYNVNPHFFRCCVEAFAESQWHVVVAVGERMDLDTFGPLPSNVEVHRLVPQLDILAHATALICHAGMGSIMEAINFGVPVLAVPQTLEQEANAARVEQLGLGAQISPADLTPAALREAIELLAKDYAVTDRIAEMRRDIQASGGTTRAADLIEQCLT